MTSVDWHGYPAWKFENRALSLVIVPALGAKIASLIDKSTGHEWMAMPTRSIRPRQYGDDFGEHDLSGWDEMFPTIDVCVSPLDAALMLPDHGEVWGLPWDIMTRSEDSITLQVHGKAFDYTLTRKAIMKPTGVRLEYTATNHSERDLPYLWAAHPLFNGADVRVVLPVSIKQVIAVDHQRIPVLPMVLDWPVATLPDGTTQQLNLVGSVALKDARKVYVLLEQSIAAASLLNETARCTLNLSWDASAAPYLGVWIDEGTYTAEATVALEPASGYYDSLERAIAQKRVSIIPTGGSMSWWVEIRLDTSEPDNG